MRTSLQHLWAELSEKLSDVLDPAIKYGGGDEGMLNTLMRLSVMVMNIESLETQLANLPTLLSAQGQLTTDKKQEIADIQDELISVRQKAYKALRDTIDRVEKGEYDALSD